jgi:hypothetical protein
MSTINYTYNVIVDRFRQFAAGHFQLRRFTHGEISQADLEKEAEWPWLHVKPRAINYAPGTRSFSFEIFISDLPRDKEDKTGYQAESITDCSLIFQDLINEIYLGNMFGTDVVLTRPVNSEPFVEQYTHTLTGVTGTIELQLDYDWSACSIPASWNYNTPTDSGSDGWGALQFIDSLNQNGAYVSLLNDEEAPGNSYYYGTDAEGVKGWHAIVDNIGLTCETLPECATIISILEDIEALQEDKANTADLGATAFSNNYNDLDNLPTIPAAQIQSDWNQANNAALDFIKNKPTIPAAQVNSDWNATSGVAEILNKPTIPSIAGLVPETRTLTINGTTQDLSANRTFTIATGLTVGTTPITSGTVGRVLFEGTGNVLQESANFFWDNTNSRLGVGTASPTKALTVKANANDEGILLQSATSGTLFQVTRDGASNNTAEMFLYAGGVIRFAIRSTSNFSYFNGGNFGIGTTTDAGFKLDVNGTARITGTGTTAATNAFTVRNSGAVQTFNVNDLGQVQIGRTTSINWTFSSNSLTSSQYAFIFSSNGSILTTGAGNGGVFGNNDGGKIADSGISTAQVASAVLEASSTTRGFLPPRMTNTQKNAIASPAAGLVVYDTTLGKLCVRTASSWETITSL